MSCPNWRERASNQHASNYKERDHSFTGKIYKITVDVQPVGAAVKMEVDAAQHETALKMAMSN